MNFLGQAANLGKGLTSQVASVASNQLAKANDLLLQADEAAGEKLGAPPRTPAQQSEGASREEDEAVIGALRAALSESQDREQRAVEAAAKKSEAEAALTEELRTAKADAEAAQTRERAMKGKVVEKLRTQGEEITKRDAAIKALEEQLNQVLEDMNSNTKALQALDASLLERLTSNDGNLLDDEELIGVLGNTKAKAAEVKEKLGIAEETKKNINEKREQFRPVATRGSVLYFSILEMF